MRNKVQHYLTESEIRQLLQQPDRFTLLGKRDYAIMLLFISTGIRLAELLSLKRSDLQTEGRKVWLYVYGKGGRQRRIPIKDHHVITALAEYWKKAKIPNEPEQAMFRTIGWRGPDKGAPLKRTAVKYLVKKYVELAGIQKNIHVHSLRHTFVTHALRKSGDLPAVQKLAGHRSITSTQVYLHTDDDRMEAAIEKMSAG